MRAWMPIAAGLGQAATEARYEAIAADAWKATEGAQLYRGEDCRHVRENATKACPKGEACHQWAEAEEQECRVDSARLKSALVLLSVARYESDYRADVDDGRRRGDGGKSWCLAQVLFPEDGFHRSLVVEGGTYRWSKDPTEGWRGRDLVDDRVKCFSAALAIAGESLRTCGNLSMYTSGRCSAKEKKAQVRETPAKVWWAKNPKSSLYPEPEPIPGLGALLVN